MIDKHNRFLLRLNQLNPNIKVLTLFKTLKTNITCECSICGHIWTPRPENLLRTGNCPNCSKNKKGTTESFILKAKEIHGNKYDYSKVEYKNNSTKVCIICPIHGEFWQTPKNHVNSKLECLKCGIIKCHNLITSNKDIFTKEAIYVHGNKYDYSKVKYVNNHTKVTIICPKHGEFKLEPNSHLLGRGCPRCKTSKGEILISNILKDLDVEYLELFLIKSSLDDYTKSFKVDFYIEHNNKKYIIEYNGQQHYFPILTFGGLDRYKAQVIRDEALRRFCTLNNFQLIEIKYDLKDDEILKLLRLTFYDEKLYSGR